MTTLDTRTTSTTRGAAITAAVTGSLVIVLSLLQPPDGPATATATAAQLRTYAVDQATAVRTGALGGVISVVVLLVFTAALAQVARVAPGGSMMADLGSAAGYLLALCLLLSTVAGAVPAILPGLVGSSPAAADDAILRGWWATAGVIHLLGDFQMALIATVIGAFSIAAGRGRLLPRWLVWAGYALTAAAALGTVGVTTGVGALYGFWFGGMFGWVLWMPVVGITLGLRERAAARRGA
jgi:hypothetical protein